MELKLTWVSDDTYPGIKHSEYKGKKLTIKPIGETEYNGIIDDDVDNWICGTDDFADTEQILIDHIDGIKRDSRVFITPIQVP